MKQRALNSFDKEANFKYDNAGMSQCNERSKGDIVVVFVCFDNLGLSF